MRIRIRYSKFGSLEEAPNELLAQHKIRVEEERFKNTYVLPLSHYKTYFSNYV